MREQEDQLIRDMLINSAATVQISDEPTILTLYDTITLLERRNKNWRDDEKAQMIFAWQASTFLESHFEEVCKEKCPELMDLCLEYRKHETINGKRLPNYFAIEAMEYVLPDPVYLSECISFSTSPVRGAYLKSEN